MAAFSRLIPAAALLALGASPAIAAPGDFAEGWGLFESGSQYVSFDLDAVAADLSNDNVVGPDGSVYLAGTVRDANGLLRIGVAKLDPDGQLDTSFSTDGKNTSLQTNVTGLAIALHGDYLYVAGHTTNNTPDLDMIVCRFRADSGVNSDFPNNGNSACVKPVALPGTQDLARAIAVQPDGKIVIAGTVGVNGPSDTYAAFARFNANGQPDTTFGTLQGSNLSVIRNNASYARHSIAAVTIASNGAIVAAGSTVLVDDTDTWGLLVRLLPNGTQVLPGAGEYAFARDSSSARDTVLQDVVTLDDPNSVEDYAIVAGSVELTSGVNSGFLARVNSTTDALTGAFGELSGYTAITLPGASFGFSDLALDGTRSIIAHGVRSSANGVDMVVRRFGMDGLPDNDFGNAGNAVIDFGTPANINQPSGLSVLGDGVYATGSILWTASNYDFAAAKLTLSDIVFSDGFED